MEANTKIKIYIQYAIHAINKLEWSNNKLIVLRNTKAVNDVIDQRSVEFYTFFYLYIYLYLVLSQIKGKIYLSDKWHLKKCHKHLLVLNQMKASRRCWGADICSHSMLQTSECIKIVGRNLMMIVRENMKDHYAVIKL